MIPEESRPPTGDRLTRQRPQDLTTAQLGRWSKLTLAGVLTLPDTGLRLFEIAIRLGRVMREDHTFRELSRGWEGVAVDVSPAKRDQILGLADQKPRAWRKAVQAWEAAGMAHRCAGLKPGTVRLFYSPTWVCPACGDALPKAEPEPRPPASEPTPTTELHTRSPFRPFTDPRIRHESRHQKAAPAARSVPPTRHQEAAPPAPEGRYLTVPELLDHQRRVKEQSEEVPA